MLRFSLGRFPESTLFFMPFLKQSMDSRTGIGSQKWLWELLHVSFSWRTCFSQGSAETSQPGKFYLVLQRVSQHFAELKTTMLLASSGKF